MEGVHGPTSQTPLEPPGAFKRGAPSGERKQNAEAFPRGRVLALFPLDVIRRPSGRPGDARSRTV